MRMTGPPTERSIAKVSGEPSPTHARPSWRERLSAALSSSPEPPARGRARGPAVKFETNADFACPGCGAVLHDLSAATCPYCGAAFAQISADLRKCVWKVSPLDDSWSIVERTCPACGSTVTDAAADRCPKCGHQPLPQLRDMDTPDNEYAAVLKIRFPPTPAGPHRATQRTLQIGRRPESNRWLVPPTVPKTIVALLQPLPDECPRCHSAAFDVTLGDQELWTVVCGECRAAPSVRANAD